MNELDWLTGAAPLAMLDYLAPGASERKLRFYACACVRRYWSRLRYAVPRQAVDLAERFADGKASLEEVEQFRQEADLAAMHAPEFERHVYQAAAATLAPTGDEAARGVQESLRYQAVQEALDEIAPPERETDVARRAGERENRALGALLVEIFGNPFRPSVIEPAWLDCGQGTVAGMATLLLEDWRFDELPYLADALVDAGCNDEFLLRHLRLPATEHVRGCWALESLARREG